MIVVLLLSRESKEPLVSRPTLSAESVLLRFAFYDESFSDFLITHLTRQYVLSKNKKIGVAVTNGDASIEP